MKYVFVFSKDAEFEKDPGEAFKVFDKDQNGLISADAVNQLLILSLMTLRNLYLHAPPTHWFYCSEALEISQLHTLLLNFFFSQKP